jgi:tRNA/tmRNA/rRNA uracil-C5-methylase (TrmA/RlmC/RlmD family)
VSAADLSTHPLVELEVEGLAFGGAAVARLPSGKAVLVHGAAPSERVRARIVADRRSLSFAVCEGVLRPSPDRVEPVCPAAGRCGGCTWMHVEVGAQRRWKRALLARELVRAELVGSEADTRLGEVVAGAALGFRTRCRLHLVRGRLGTLAARSHEVVELSRCPVLAPSLERFALELGAAVATARLADADVELYVDAAGRRGLALSAGGAAAGWDRVAADLGVAALLEERSAGATIAFEPGSFVQTNREMNDPLVQAVLAGAAPCAGPDRLFAEVYAGVGNLTVHLAELFGRGAAFERDRRSVAALRRNLGPAGARVEAVAARDDRAARRLSATRFDLLVADPPRAGMAPLREVLLERRRPRRGGPPPARVVMASCHPMAAVRDLAHLVRVAGYRLVAVTPIDVFPQTHHLELVAVMERL